jgi:sulfur transfer protein SufE
VRVRIDRWLVELISEYVESRRPSEIRAFVREAVVEHLGLRERVSEERCCARARR